MPESGAPRGSGPVLSESDRGLVDRSTTDSDRAAAQPFSGVVQFIAVEDAFYPIVAILAPARQYEFDEVFRYLWHGSVRPSPVSWLRRLGPNRFGIYNTVTPDVLRERYRAAYGRVRSMRATAEPGRRTTYRGQVTGPPPDVATWQPPSWLPEAVSAEVRGGTLEAGSHRYAGPPPGGSIVVWVHREGTQTEYQFFQYFPTNVESLRRITGLDGRPLTLLRDTLVDYNRRMQVLVEERQMSPAAARRVMLQSDIEALMIVVNIATSMAQTGMTAMTIANMAPRVVRASQTPGQQSRAAVRRAARRRASEPSSGGGSRSGLQADLEVFDRGHVIQIGNPQVRTGAVRGFFGRIFRQTGSGRVMFENVAAAGRAQATFPWTVGMRRAARIARARGFETFDVLCRNVMTEGGREMARSGADRYGGGRLRSVGISDLMYEANVSQVLPAGR